MNTVQAPQNYRPALDSYDTQQAISFIKNAFLRELCRALNLKRVSAPLFVLSSTGLNDDLSGTERPVSFDIPAVNTDAQVVHSLAKWKRLALKRYDFKMHEGLVTDMNAIRRDEDLDNVHSIYVDQWDWEKIIDRPDRTLDYLKETVRAIVHAICAVNEQLQDAYPQLRTKLREKVTFITSQELEDLYPDLTPEGREHEFTKLHKTVFIMQIGGKLRSGKPHGSRAPDYDDWALNGDLLFWDEILGRSLELSSMGIRVDAESLDRQLKIANADARRKFTFHQMLLSDLLPLTIGGGIGQSRLCMLMMECAHIGEVQSSVWDRETIEFCERNGIPLL